MSAPTYAPSTTGPSWTGLVHSTRAALRAVLLALVIVVLTSASFVAGRATAHSHTARQPAPIFVPDAGSFSSSACVINRPC